MFTICNVLHDKTKKRKQTPESAQYGLEIIFKVAQNSFQHLHFDGSL